MYTDGNEGRQRVNKTRHRQKGKHIYTGRNTARHTQTTDIRTDNQDIAV